MYRDSHGVSSRLSGTETPPEGKVTSSPRASVAKMRCLGAGGEKGIRHQMRGSGLGGLGGVDQLRAQGYRYSSLQVFIHFDLVGRKLLILGIRRQRFAVSWRSMR